MLAARTNLHTFTSEERQQQTKQLYTETSYFQQQFGMDKVEITCQATADALRDQLIRLLLAKNLIHTPLPLEKLHEVMSPEMCAYNFDDGVNKISTYFYDTDNTFLQVYYEYIWFLRENVIKEPFWFQAVPTIRIHCPNGKNNHHYPRYHTDIGYGHPPEEINIWLPLTEVLTGHGFRVMSVENSKEVLAKFAYHYPDFIHSAINDKAFSAWCDSLSSPITTPFGKMLAFDSRSVHTGEPLKVHTRASMDIRVLPLSEYAKMTIEYQGSGRRKILFTPGHCYHPKHSDQLFT